MTHASGLAKRELTKIERGIPDAYSIHRAIVSVAYPPFIEFAYLPERTLKGIAWVCLTDAAEMLAESRYALIQASAHRVAYDRIPEADDGTRMSRLFMAQFYMDDTVLRLYATAESVAECLKVFYNAELAPTLAAAKKPRASQFMNVCNAIGAVRLPGTLAITMLSTGGAPETVWVTSYRNDWMHGQRQRMEGTGLGFDRKQRLQEITTEQGGTAITIGFGGGDPHKFTIAEAMNNVSTVYSLLRNLVVLCRETLELDLPKSGDGWERKPVESGIAIRGPRDEPQR